MVRMDVEHWMNRRHVVIVDKVIFGGVGRSCGTPELQYQFHDHYFLSTHQHYLDMKNLIAGDVLLWERQVFQVEIDLPT